MNTLRPLLSTLLFLSALVLPLRGQSAQVQDSQPETGTTPSPYFWVKGGDPSMDALPLKATTVKASIAGVMAEVKVIQVYRNEGSKALEASYVFPGSTRAAVNAMTMTVGDRVLKAVIREKGAARREYEAARAEGRTASLLEQDRPNVFQMQVANILPGDTVQVELTYGELLVPREGVYTFVYPTVVGPRYTTGAPAASQPLALAKSAPTGTFDLELGIQTGMAIEDLHCDSHPIVPLWDSAQRVQVSLQPTETPVANRDFSLSYRLAGGQIQSGLLLQQGEAENFFLVMLQPPQRVVPSAIPPREYLFIVDVSGSMAGYPLETAKILLKSLIGGLRPGDRFNIVTFAAGQRVWSPEASKPVSAGNLLSALEFIDAQSGRGGTELLAAFKTALALPGSAGMARTAVLVSDGYVKVEPQVLDLIRDHLNELNVFAFGIGTSVNHYLMEGIAHVGQGEVFTVAKPAEALKEADRFRRYIASPLLTHVTIKFEGFDAYDVEPAKVPDVFADRPVLCFGKWRGEAKGSIEISGLTGAGEYRQIIPVNTQPDAANGALRHLWARHRIMLLGDYGRLGGVENQAEITALGLKYSLLTNYTSFVAVDTLVRNPTGELASVKQPLPLPLGVSELVLAPGIAGDATVIRGSSGSAISYRIDGISVRDTSLACCCAAADVDAGISVMKPALKVAAQSPRRSVTFILGQDEDASLPVYQMAERYFREDPLERTDEVVTTAGSLEAVRDYLMGHAPIDGRAWGLVNLVVHGRSGMLAVPLRMGAIDTTTESLAEALLHRPFAALPDGILDARSEIRIHGCDVGRDPLLLGRLSRLLGGSDPQRPLVRASRYFTCFQKGALATQRFLTEAWSLVFRPGERPSDAALAARFRARYPAMGVRAEAALSRIAARAKGDAFSYESATSIRWTLLCPSGGLPLLPSSQTQIRLWIRSQEDLMKHVIASDAVPEDFHWELQATRRRYNGLDCAAISALGVGRKAYILRSLENPGTETSLSYQDERFFSAVR